MKRVLIALLLAISSVHAQDAATGQGDGPDPWFGTFSIIAFDPVDVAGVAALRAGEDAIVTLRPLAEDAAPDAGCGVEDNDRAPASPGDPSRRRVRSVSDTVVGVTPADPGSTTRPQ